MNFSNHFHQIDDDYLTLITEQQVNQSANLFAEYGFVSLADLNDLGNMMLMGWEMNR